MTRAIAVATLALGLSGCQRAPPAGTFRLFDHLETAKQLPPAAEEVALLEAPGAITIPAGQVLWCSFRAPPESALSMRVEAKGKGASAALVSLPREASSPSRPGCGVRAEPPNAQPLGAALDFGPASQGYEVLRRDALAPRDGRELAVVVHGEAARRLSIRPTMLPPPGWLPPATLAPLVVRFPRLTGDMPGWEDSLLMRAGNTASFAVEVPPGGRLLVELGFAPGEPGSRARFRIQQDGATVFDQEVLDRRDWIAVARPLQPRSRSLLTLTADCIDPCRSPPAWGDPRIVSRALRPNVLLVTWDAVRPDHLSGYGYGRDTAPTLARLARRGVQFQSAYAQSGYTWTSVMSLLTGLQPFRSGATRRGEWPSPDIQTLPMRLAAAGYQTYAGDDLGTYPPAQMAGFDRIDFAPWAAKSAPLGQRAQALAERMKDGASFAWVHLEHAHYPLMPRDPLRYAAHAAGRFANALSPEDARGPLGPLTPAERQQVVALYDSTIRDDDDDLAEFLGALAREGVLDQTIVIVTADHGDHLVDHDKVSDHGSLLPDVLHVPWVMAGPGIAPREQPVSGLVSLADLVPTLIDLLGLGGSPELDGVSQRRALRGGPAVEAPVFAEEEGNQIARFDHDFEVILRTKGFPPQIDRYFLIDLHQDPSLALDVSSQHRAEGKERLHLLLDTLRTWKPPELKPVGQSAREALLQAGYLQEHAR